MVPIGLFYRSVVADRYDEFTQRGIGMPDAEKVEAAQAAIDRFLI